MDAFHYSSTELDDWLSLLDHMIVTQRVRVGDLSEISDLIVKLKVSAVNVFLLINCCAVTILLYDNVVILNIKKLRV